MTKFYKKFDATLSFTGTLDIAKIHDALSFNKMAIIALVVNIVIAAVSSYFLSHLRGLVVSIALSVIGVVIGYFAIKEITTIERYIEMQAKR